MRPDRFGPEEPETSAAHASARVPARPVEAPHSGVIDGDTLNAAKSESLHPVSRGLRPPASRLLPRGLDGPRSRRPGICLLTPSVFSQDGGIQRVTQMVIRYLREARPTAVLQVLSLHDSSTQPVPTWFGAELEAGRLAFHPNDSHRFRFAQMVVHTLAQSRPELVVSLHAHLNVLPWLVAPLSRPSVVSFVYHAELATLGPLRRRALRRADLVLAISEFTAAETRPLLRPDQPLHVCHLGLFPDYPVLAQERPAAPPYLEGRRVILSVGRMAGGTRDKGHTTLLAALPAVVQRFPQALLVIVGQGPDEPRLRQHVEHLGMQSHVHFAGWVRDEDLPAYYQACELFAMPSQAEGFGLVYLEAMHHARPCIAGRDDAAREVIQNGQTGLLVEPGNANQVQAALLRLLGEPETARRMGAAGRARLEQNFLYRHFSARLDEQLEPFTIGLRTDRY